MTLDNQQICCIVPFYNEGPRVLTVLKALTQSNQISKIICVDDGSTDNGSYLISKSFPNIKLTKLSHNLGKADAVKAGLKDVDTKYVFLCDADLSDIKIDKLDKYIGHVATYEDVDMLVFKINASPKWMLKMAQINRGDILSSGLRILKTKDLKNVFRLEKPKRYSIESAINRYMRKHSKNCQWQDCIAFQIHKSEKTGFIKGWIDDAVTTYQIVDKGIIDWLKMSLTFCKKKYEIG